MNISLDGVHNLFTAFFQQIVYRLFIALKMMAAFWKKVVSELRFRRYELVLIRIKRKPDTKATPHTLQGVDVGFCQSNGIISV